MPEERRSLSLSAIRADGWFERVGGGSKEFAQLCDFVGKNYVAFSVIAGVRITTLTVDRRIPDASVVEFVVGEEKDEQSLSLGEFRKRLATALIGDEKFDEGDPTLGTPEEAQRVLGVHNILLSAIYQVGLLELRLGGGTAATILVDVEGNPQQLTLGEFRSLIRDRVRSEIGAQPTPFAIDLARVAQAEASMASQDYQKTVELLGDWPGPLSILLRTGEGQALPAESKAQLAHALGLLGTAYARQQQHDTAEETLRLGIQWGHDGEGSGDLFRRLGESHVARERYGEAIGILRHALALGAPARDVMPLLAKCFAARKRFVAAMACVDEALAAGAPLANVYGVSEEASAALGEAWTNFRDAVPGQDRPSLEIPPTYVGTR
ncbi:MAG: tetratricopeptide repeat protein [Sandaracinaceae bacterium]|nr:tetratricopeptide repeat protein [Sandaracinaceae bacterium]